MLFDGERDACGVGFVAHIKGERSRAIVDQGLEVLRRLSHRAACGADPETGDGAGILIQLPERFFRARRRAARLRSARRTAGSRSARCSCRPIRRLRAACERHPRGARSRDEGQRVIGWRDVPIDLRARRPRRARRDAGVPPDLRAHAARAAERVGAHAVRDPQARREPRSASAAPIRRATSTSRACRPRRSSTRACCCRAQLPQFFVDLQSPELASAIAVVHSRFSTNTFPTWDLAQPFRYIAHNGEINTLRGNAQLDAGAHAASSRARSSPAGSSGCARSSCPGKSDSAQFDNMVELLTLGGRTLPHSMMMMIPEAWEGNAAMDDERKSFYRYASSLVEPWDGPAAIVFSDGQLVGATLDRNGLRPARWTITTDDRVILASETGVIDVPPERVRQKGRLHARHDVRRRHRRGPHRRRRRAQARRRRPLPVSQVARQERVRAATSSTTRRAPPPIDGDELLALQRAFGYTDEDLELIIEPMAADRQGADRLDGHRHAARGAVATARRTCSRTSTSCSRRSRTRRSIRSARRS